MAKRKATLPDKPVRGNQAKYLCYREAWVRVNLAAGEQEFPFEAIAILESIMADRIASYLAAHGDPSPSPHESLG